MTRSMTIGIISNPTKDINYEYANKISNWLAERNHTPVIMGSRGLVPLRSSGADPHDLDFLIILGGDGTMLQAARTAAQYSIPMLGINLGNLGYLTDVDRHDGIKAVEKMLAGDFRREQRMMLEVRGSIALNEAVVHRDGPSKLVAFKICVNGDHMDTLRADGILVATPTGSTAYNLSAGGPILRPDSEMIVVTAVCPHTLYTRPWVLSGSDEVSIEPVDGEAVVSLDGEPKFELTGGEPVVIRRSEHTAIVVKTGADFFEVLRKKLKNES